MNFFDIMSLALRNLRQSKLRTALTVIGVVIGVGAIITMVSLGLGLQQNILAKIVLTNAVREQGMRELYRMNITYSTLFPDLDGLARSMGYELEFHWAYNPRTLEKFNT